ncbi:MAG: glutamate--tRNA ligase [Opitutales bacterium]|nr:glutamate--tRNA ligase [Opitutales bacterium]
MDSPVRVRFAPSPTGFFHIGSARTALFNWLFARHHGGTFILRIEDTDKERNSPEFLNLIYESLRWLGMDWDEGPFAGGDRGPYLQSERSPIYQAHLEQLKSAGRTYEKDGATFFRLEGERYTEFDTYLNAEVEKVRAAPVLIDDVIRGPVERAEERDFVLVRANGEPTFHFVNVVDDLTMGITHVIRGEDHLSNTSKHIELFRALGATPPRFAHLPLILKDPAAGKGKMSKRDKGALIEEYRQRHFLPAAVRNFIALLGWSPKNDQEVLDIGEIIERFRLEDIQKSPARFDEKKMAHINFEHLKALPIESYAWCARPVLTESGVLPESADETQLQQVLSLCQPKVDNLENLPSFSRYFFSDDYPEDPSVRERLLKKGEPKQLLDELIPALEELEPWTAPALDDAFAALAGKTNRKVHAWWPLCRFGVSGVGGGPDFLPMLEVLGKPTVVTRLRRFRDTL